MRNRRGFTIIEMMVAVAIIMILISFVSLAFDPLLARGRFARVKSDMDAISKTAFEDFAQNEEWANDEMFPGVMPANFEGKLQRWPKPPCKDWEYKWDNWMGTVHPCVKVSLCRPDGTALWVYCLSNIDSAGVACDFDDLGVVPTPQIVTITKKEFACSY